MVIVQKLNRQIKVDESQVSEYKAKGYELVTLEKKEKKEKKEEKDAK